MLLKLPADSLFCSVFGMPRASQQRGGLLSVTICNIDILIVDRECAQAA